MSEVKLSRTERMQRIDPILDRVNNIYRDLKSLLSDLDSGLVADMMTEIDAVQLSGFVTESAKVLDIGADLLKYHALRND